MSTTTIAVPQAPPDVHAALVELTRQGELLTVELRPWAAWQLALVCQLLAHNPHLSDVVRPALESVGRLAQAALTEACPAAGPVLEAGWARDGTP